MPGLGLLVRQHCSMRKTLIISIIIDFSDHRHLWIAVVQFDVLLQLGTENAPVEPHDELVQSFLSDQSVLKSFDLSVCFSESFRKRPTFALALALSFGSLAHTHRSIQDVGWRCRSSHGAVRRLFGNLLLQVEEELVVGQRRLRSVLDHVLQKAGLQLALVPDDVQRGSERPLVFQPSHKRSHSLGLRRVQLWEEIQVFRHSGVARDTQHL